MSHMVIFNTPDGSEVFNRFDSLDEAIPFLEKLRNQRGVDNAKLFSMQEIEFGFKPIYKVTLGPPAVEAGPSAARPEAPPVETPPRPSAFSSEAPRFTSEEPVGAEPAPVSVGAEFSAPENGSSSAPIFGMPAAVPPSDSGSDEPTSRRGLFGR